MSIHIFFTKLTISLFVFSIFFHTNTNLAHGNQADLLPLYRNFSENTVYLILNSGTRDATAPSDENTIIFGTQGQNTITVESGAEVTLIHFPGNNTIEIMASSTIFSVYRHGAIVHLEGSDGTTVNIPATTQDQEITFTNRPLTLSIQSGNVMLGSQIITTTSASIDEQEENNEHEEAKYPIVDTGQTTFYDDNNQIPVPLQGDAFYGQDAQFNSNQPNYSVGSDGQTVKDNVTGLTWTQTYDINGDGEIDSDDKLTFSEFQEYPDTLNAQNFGGYDDWRIPTIKELYSLINFSGTDPNPMAQETGNLTPFIDTDYFGFSYGDTSSGDRIIDSQAWSGTSYVDYVFGNQLAAFGVNFADGRIKGYPSSDIMQKTNYAYFVRGNPDYGINIFTNNNDGTITDEATGLMWAQDDSKTGMNWEETFAWVQEKNEEYYLGYNDWRLPNAKEMQSIINYEKSPATTGTAAIDPVFNITKITNENGEDDYPWFWTGTTHAKASGDGNHAAYICFGRALGYVGNSWLDVHGAGAQRSDQKGGSFSMYTYITDGYYFQNSPQGDAVRIYNYARLVRDAD
ncbi:conserved exported hypothetical protein [Desulfamplus magnetovallimortis]|uniref:Lcl C-terminal domain-containing protein n=1 Tax=Desulfamplus magnetovallimortis TaxID=1246637 RepID=A0A1W1HHN6_9BACT|nr:DUF1566 domain-containing protein [Desulfamplus magnetovallimortis]SLM31989.1 conserved exported hypothetical protein [Desulfamplus magnetovallimortis]